MSTPIISSPSQSKTTFRKNAPVKFSIPQSKPEDFGLFKANPFLRSCPVGASKSSAKVGASEKGMTTATAGIPVASKNLPIASFHHAPIYNSAAKLFYPPNSILSSAEPDFTKDAKPIELPSASELPSFKRNTPSRKNPLPPADLPLNAASTAASRYKAEEKAGQTEKRGTKRSRVLEEKKYSDDEEPIIRKRQRRPVSNEEDSDDDEKPVFSSQKAAKVSKAPAGRKKKPVVPKKGKFIKEPVLKKKKLVEPTNEQIKEQTASVKEKKYVCPLMASLGKKSGYTFK